MPLRGILLPALQTAGIYTATIVDQIVGSSNLVPVSVKNSKRRRRRKDGELKREEVALVLIMDSATLWAKNLIRPIYTS